MGYIQGVAPPQGMSEYPPNFPGPPALKRGVLRLYQVSLATWVGQRMKLDFDTKTFQSHPFEEVP